MVVGDLWPEVRVLKRIRGEIHHVEINVSNLKRSCKFYQKFLGWLGYHRTLDDKEVVGWRRGNHSIFLVQSGSRFGRKGFHRKNVGLNHMAFWLSSRKEIDDLYRKHLLRWRVRVLYGGPKEYPEYSKGYYALYFEDPDRIKLEAVHIPQRTYA